MAGALPLWSRVLLFTLLVPGSVLGLAPWLLLRIAQPGWRVDFAGAGLAGAAALALGLAVYAGCAIEFAARGSGTPAPFDPPRRLVVSGLYRHVRNPMYVGVLLALAGESLLTRSLPLAVYAASFALAFHLRVVLHEEPALQRAFGADFEAYRANVPRWLPRLPGWRPGRSSFRGSGAR